MFGMRRGPLRLSFSSSLTSQFSSEIRAWSRALRENSRPMRTAGGEDPVQYVNGNALVARTWVRAVMLDTRDVCALPHASQSVP